MNSKATKKPLKPESKIKTKVKPKAKSKPKISKLKVQGIKAQSLSNTHCLSDTPSVSHRYPPNSLQYFSERASLNLKKNKPDTLGESIGYLNCQIRMKELVTEQDVLILSDESDVEESYSFTVNQSCDGYQVSMQKAATAIQKMWRGYKTRKLIRYHIEGSKKTKIIVKDDFQKTHKLLHNRKKSSLEQVVDLTETKHLGDIRLSEILKTSSEGMMSPIEKQVKTQFLKNNRPHKKVEEQLEKLKKEQAEKWSEIIQLIQYIPTEDIHGNQLLKTLINKSEENKSQLQVSKHLLPIDPSPSKSPTSVYEDVDVPNGPMMIVNEHKFTEPLSSDRQSTSGFPDHPFIKIIELQSKMMKDRLDIQLKRLDKKHKSFKISNQVYEHKKQMLLKDFEEEERTILSNKSQINFSLQKAHNALISSKRDANFLYRTTGRETSLRHSLSDESVLLNSFIKQRLFIEQQLSSCASQESVKMKRTSTELQSVESPQVIIQQLSMNLKTEEQEQPQQSQQMKSIKQTAEIIQKHIERHIIEQLCGQIYLNDKLATAFLPHYEVQNFYKFRKLNDIDIDSFLKVMMAPPFRPTKQDLLKRLNQKINPSARELLKILRNQEPEEDEDSQFYELVIPQQVFKQFREWKETSIVTDLYLPPTIKDPIKIIWNEEEQVKLEERQQSTRERKKKILKFEKDLQAMYYKAVFNCFNQSIIEVKCSYSPLNGRSTIGPGELRVSLLDSNTPVALSQVDSIMQKGKLKVLQNFKYRCPSLDSTSYNSLNRFQQALMKQIQNQFDLNEHKWISFFDQYLQIATELTSLITEHLYMEATKEIFKMQLCRI